MQINKYSLKKKIIAGPIFFFALAGSIIFFIIMPSIDDIKYIKEEVEMQRIDLEKKYVKGQSLKQLKENLKKIKPELEMINNAFIVSGHELDFITTLENFAHKNNVEQKINMNAFKDLNESQVLQKIPLNLSLKGNFTNLINYLIDLEASHYYININSLEILSTSAKSFVPNKNPNNSNNVSITLSANIYWVKK